MLKFLSTFAFLYLLTITPLYAQQVEYEKLKTEAEKLYSEASYEIAHEIYLKADTLELPLSDARWVDFRVADTLWRAQAGTQTPDSTKYDKARQQIEALVRDIQRLEEHDRIWAEVQESLGDFWWTRRDSRNWHNAWPYYHEALDWWAGADDIELARGRYLKIVWTITKPPGSEPYYYYGSYGNLLPIEILENVLKISQTDNDKAHTHYLIAMTLRQYGGKDYLRRLPEEFEAALKPGKSTDWYDDALYHYAEWWTSYGRVTKREGNEWRQEPDYVKALELFHRLLNEYEKGETRYYDQAKNQIENITKPVVGVSVSNIFLPDSEIQFHLNWRNVKRVDFTLYKVDLTRDVQFSDKNIQPSNWIQIIDLAGRKKVKSWMKETGDKGDYKPGNEMTRLDDKLPVGAYVIEAKGKGASARELVLVTDVSVVLKTSNKQALVYFCNASDGSPVANANVKLSERSYNGMEYVWREDTNKTDKDGICIFNLTDTQRNIELFVSGESHDRQAFSTGYSHGYRSDTQTWRIYAFTDRPAYRPDETAQWKFIVRKYDGSVYSTPSDETIEFQINDPRGAKVKEGKVTLNAFGSAWGSLELTSSMPLGEYRIRFWDEGYKKNIGDAVLFRLEEYKLPEFKVNIQTSEEDGKKKTFLLGEKVEVTIQADYYFGGPVSNAAVEVLVHQKPFYHWWQPPHDFPWFYEDMMPQRISRGYGEGQVIKRETLKTDTTGKAMLTFETPKNAGQDFEYRIEARVTDVSRREIAGSDMVRVTRQRYYVYPRAEHNIYRPQDRVKVDIKTIDANDQPVAVNGAIKVTRDYWTDSGGRPGQPKFRGYQHDEILTRTVKTDDKGEAEFTFTPEREGYYRIAWTSQDKGSELIKTETTVWVATNATTELGYRHGGLEIIVDKDTFLTGQKSTVMLTAPMNDRYVLFSVEGENLYSYQLVHLTGTVKLIEIAIEEKHIPNIFLSAAMVSDRQIFTDTKQVIVPPVRHFLTVDVKSDREQYQPQEEGTLLVTTHDHEGKPVSAEVALGLVDESVYYIQQDYAGNPQQFYYGTKRQQYIQTRSTFQQKNYAKLVENAEKQLIDERFLKTEIEEKYRPQYDYDVNSLEIGSLARHVKVRGDISVNGIAEMEKIDEYAFKEKGGFRLGAALLAKPSGEAIPGQEPVVQVRTDFRSTVFWQPDVITDKDGKTIIKVKYPDSLTSWKTTARVVTEGNQFGIAHASTHTKKPLIVRLQAPRFFVVGDTVTISAVINNNTEKAMTVTPSLDAEGGVVIQDRKQSSVNVRANGEVRIDWIGTVQKSGNVKLKVTAHGDKYADAMEKNYIVYEHGIEKFISKSGKVRGNDIKVKIDIPKERKSESTTLTVQVTPSMAVTMLDALPYLIDYPYGCIEQTMSRFIPAAITAKTLKDLGIQPEIVMEKVFKTHPQGKKDLHKLDEIVKQGMDRLYDFQHSDGGWGWWKQGESDHFMTAYVVWGLTLARDAHIDVKRDVIERGVRFLDKEIVEEEVEYDLQAWMLHALSCYYASVKQKKAGKFQEKAFENLWTNKDKLNAYTRALLTLSAHNFGYTDKAKTLVQNIANGVKIDKTPDTSVIQEGVQNSNEAVIGTAHWGEDGIYWRWSEGGVEATAFALRALLAIDPENELIEPVTNWLIKNRRGAQWSNTRDTAIVVLALNDYLRQSEELKPELSYELLVNGNSIVTRKLTAKDVLSMPSQFEIERKYIRDGANEIHIKRKGGDGPIYFAAQAKFFSLEEPILSTGNEIFIRRQYYKLVGRPTLLKGYVYDKQPFNDGETITSGERVETVLTIEAKNNYEYLVLEDLKPAGLEAVQIRSGDSIYAKELKSGAVERKFSSGKESAESFIRQIGSDTTDYTGRTRWVYQELRDRKVALFIDKLPEGVWEIHYDLRAEVPGKFHALPVLGHAMYVPEIRCNGTEVRINVEDIK